jgi:hypothetical protein
MKDKKSVLKLIYSILNSKTVENRFWNTSLYNKESGAVIATLGDALKLVEELYNEELKNESEDK